MNSDPIIDRLLDAYRKKNADTAVDQKCQALIDTLRDPARMRELIATDTDRPMAEFTPRKFGEFELNGWIGAGGMGQVYRALHPQLGRVQALKMLPPERVTNAEAMSRFKREIRAIGQLNHPSIVTVYDAGEVDGTPYLTMELIDGQSLSEVVRDARREGRNVDVATACRLIADAAEGIQHAHDNGVLHRDIKPGNLMLDSQGRVRILDLGLAKFVDTANAPHTSETAAASDDHSGAAQSFLTDKQLTAAQQILGTPDYMAPEQISSDSEVDARTDVYSLAATLHHLLTGETLFGDAGSNLLRKALAVLQNPAPLVSEKRSDLPEGLDAAIAKALSKDPDERPQSAAEFAAILRPFVTPVVELAATPDPETQVALPQNSLDSSPPSRRIGIWLLALLPLGAAIAGLLIVLNGPDGSRLQIESDDPNVKVVATWAGETDKKSSQSPMQFEATPGKPATLRAGQWVVSIDGDQSGRYELSQTELILKDGETKRLVVRRTGPKAIVTSRENTTVPAIVSRIADAKKSRPSDAELLQRFDTIDWKPGEQNKRHHGLVAQPAPIDGIPSWQVQSTFPAGGKLINVSPKGTYLVVRAGYSKDFFVYVRESGRMCGVIDAAHTSYSHIAWSPDETRLLAMNEHLLRQGRVFRPDGTFLHDWKNELVAPRFSWSPDGQHVLVANRDSMQMRTAEGELVKSFIAPKHGNPETQFTQPWSPDSSMFACVNEEALMVYGKDGGDPITQVTCSTWTQFAWHPSGKYVAYHDQQGLSICTVDGQSRTLVKGSDPNDAITWSPDGAYVGTSSGAIYDMSGAMVSQIELPYRGGWKGNLIRWDTADKLTVISKFEPGSFVEMTPSGKLSREVSRPVPLPVALGTWRKKMNRLVSCFPSTYDFQFDKKWIFDWDENGGGKSLEFGNSIGNIQGTESSIGWNEDRELLSIADTDGVHTFNLDGKLISHVAKGKYAGQASWSPDGKKLAVAYKHEDDVIVYENGKPRTFSFDDSMEKRLQWLANSKQLVVNNTGSDHFAIISLEDSERTEFQSQCFNPVSPSGKWRIIAEKIHGDQSKVVLQASYGASHELELEDSKFDWWKCCWNDDETELVLMGIRFGNETAVVHHYNIATRDLSTHGQTHSFPDTHWQNGRFMFLFWNFLQYRDGFDDELAKITMPKMGENAILARGRRYQSEQGDGNPVSNSGRYVSSILKTKTHINREYGGNLCIADLQENKVAWTGIAFNDGNRAVIDNEGRVREIAGADFDKYLTYTIAYEGNGNSPLRFVPLTRLQFAARIGLPKTQLALQTVLDLGGRLELSENRMVVAADVTDARDLPQPGDVVGFSFENKRYLTVDLINTLVELPGLRRLNISGTSIDDSFSAMLPDSIEELDVSHTNVGDFILFDLGQLQSLRKLNLTATNVTPRAVANLQKKIPECEIVFDGDVTSNDSQAAERISDEALLARLNKVDWKPGKAQVFDGYAATPTDLPGIQPGRWQVITPYPHSYEECVISPRGNYVATWHHPKDDPYVRIIDRRTGRLIGMFKHSMATSYQKRVWSRDETSLLEIGKPQGSDNFQASVFRRNGILISRWTSDFQANIAAWSPDGKRILLANDDAMEQRRPDGTLVESFQAPQHGFDKASLQRHVWSPDGTQFAGVIKNEIYVYDADGGEPVAVIKADNLDSAGILWHPSGEKLLTSDGRLWNLAGDHVKFRIDRLHEQILAFSPDGRYFVTNHGDVRDLTDRVVSGLDVSEMGYIQSQDARWVKDDVITFFSARTRGPGYSVDFSTSGKLMTKWDHPVPIPQHSYTWTRDADRLVSLANPLTFQTEIAAKRFDWGLKVGDVEESGNMSEVTYSSAAFSPTSSDAVFQGAVVFDEKGAVRQRIDGLRTGLFRSWSSDGKQLAIAGDHGTDFVEVYEGTKKVCRLEHNKSQPRGLQWSPSNKHLCVWTDDKKVYLWDIATPAKPLVSHNFVGISRDVSYLSKDFSAPAWSPDGSRLAIPTDGAVLLVSPTGEADIKLPWDKSSVGTIWWHPDGKKIIAGNVLIDVASKTSQPIGGADRRLHFIHWIDQNQFVGADRNCVYFWDKPSAEPTCLRLPEFHRSHRALVTMPMRGLNANWVSDSGRYLALPISILFEVGAATGDIVIVDLQERKLLWAGITFSDGNRVQVEPTGRVASVPIENGKYIQYMIGYSHERRVPLTSLQFASRIGLSPAHRRLQELIDVGGTVVADQPLNDQNQRDSRDLPELDRVQELLLIDCPYDLGDDAFSFGANLPALSKVDFSGSGVSLKDLAFIQNAPALRTLNISGSTVDNRVAAILPPNLHELDVSNTDVGDFLVRDLRLLKSLRKVDVSGTRVTQKAIDELAKQKPECEIVSNRVSVKD